MNMNTNNNKTKAFRDSVVVIIYRDSVHMHPDRNCTKVRKCSRCTQTAIALRSKCSRCTRPQLHLGANANRCTTTGYASECITQQMHLIDTAIKCIF